STAASASIVVDADVGRVSCESAAVELVGTTRYMSGTRQVRNPDFARKRDELIDREEELTRLERKELEHLEALARAEEEVERAWRCDFRRFKEASDEAESRFSREQEDLDREERELERLQDKLDAVRGQGG